MWIGVSNCYWLTGTADRGIGETSGVTDNTVSKTESELKGLATTLGDKFTQDTNNKNGGYPILKWQQQVK